MMIDSLAIASLLKYIDDAVTGIGEITEEVPHAIEKGMKLLLVSYGKVLYFLEWSPKAVFNFIRIFVHG